MRTTAIPTPPESGGIPPFLPYRLVRARRLLALCILLPAAAAWGGAAAPWAAPCFTAPDWPLAVAAGAAPLFALLILAYPRGHIENLALALTLAAAVAAIPVIPALAALDAKNETANRVFLSLLLACAIFALWLGLIWLSALLPNPRREGRRLAFPCRTRLPPDAALDAIAPRPGQSSGRIRCGPGDADGWFEVSVTHPDFDLSTLAPTTVEDRYWTKILEDMPGRRVSLSAVELDGVWRISTAECLCRETPSGTICEIRECTDCLGPRDIATWWLTDAGRDWCVSRFSDAAGLPSPALQDQPVGSLAISLVRLFRAAGLYEPG